MGLPQHAIDEINFNGWGRDIYCGYCKCCPCQCDGHGGPMPVFKPSLDAPKPSQEEIDKEIKKYQAEIQKWRDEYPNLFYHQKKKEE
jgi:hypothetical protein